MGASAGELEVNEATNELLVPAESSSTAHEETNVVPDVIELVTEECSSEVDLPHNEQVNILRAVNQSPELSDGRLSFRRIPYGLHEGSSTR